MKRNFFCLDHGVVNVVAKLSKYFFCLDYGAVNVVTKWKEKVFPLLNKV